MNRIIIILVNLLICAGIVQAQRTCGVDDLLQELYQNDRASYNAFIQISDQTEAQTRNEIIIPIVIHVIYSEEKNNISEFQVLSQLEALNDGFQNKATDLDGVLPAHQSIIATTNFRFQLACTDPNGNFTNGITRTQTTIPNIGIYRNDNNQYAAHHTESGGKDPWPTKDYVNVWVTEFENEFLGRSSIPMPLADPFEDGVVINVRNFGYAGIAIDRNPYHLGRTLVHELGHYLGLTHTWGRGSGSCLFDDGVSDTPEQSEVYYDCPSEHNTSSCGSPDMARNIMGYADDACLLYFTEGQVNRMTNTLYGYRASLLESKVAENCGRLPNDNDEISFWNHISNQEWIARFPTQQEIISADIYNMKGQLVQSFSFDNTDLVHINTFQFSAGLYIIQFSFNGKTEQRKVAVF